MSQVQKQFTFSSGAVVVASEHNTNFDDIYNEFNGNISNTNISGSAAIAYSKLNLTGSILNADIATDASIAASKLDLGSPNNIGSTTPSRGTFTNLIADTDLKVSTGSTVKVILDQDDMHGDSDEALATQQSIKAYVDANAGGAWKYVSTTTVSGATASSDIAISQGVIYKAVLIVDNTTVFDDFGAELRFNSDSGNHYGNDGEAITASDSIVLTDNFGTAANGGSMIIEIVMSTAGSDRMIVTGTSAGIGHTTAIQGRQVIGAWDNSDTVTSFEMVSDRNVNATIQLYSQVTS